jgi:hypothetical protein
MRIVMGEAEGVIQEFIGAWNSGLPSSTAQEEWRNAAPPTLQVGLLFQNVATGNCSDTSSTLH